MCMRMFTGGSRVRIIRQDKKILSSHADRKTLLHLSLPVFEFNQANHCRLVLPQIRSHTALPIQLSEIKFLSIKVKLFHEVRPKA